MVALAALAILAVLAAGGEGVSDSFVAWRQTGFILVSYRFHTRLEGPFNLENSGRM